MFFSVARLEIERDAAFTPVAAHKICAFTIHKRRPLTHFIAVRRLDFDNIGAHLCRQHGRDGTRYIAGAIKYPDAVEDARGLDAHCDSLDFRAVHHD
jgi:hypothetical protein